MQIRLDFSPEQSLRSLCALRGCAMLGLLAAILGVHYGLGLPLPILPMLAIVLGLGLWTALALWRLRQPWVITQLEIVLHLAVDALALTLLFALSGGPGNPFVSFYLVPIAIAAVMLSRAWAWVVTLLCMAQYSWLIADFAQHLHHHSGAEGFQLHVLGMWLNFLLSAVLVTIFVTAIAEAVRRRDRSLAAVREEVLRNEQIMAVGTLAAGAAHELSTPLSTMAITISELREQHDANPPLIADLKLLSGQIAICRQQLDTLLSTAGQARAGQLPTLSLRDFLHGIFDRWRLMRPDIRLELGDTLDFADTMILAEPTLSQSILAALNNSADASVAAGESLVRASYTCDGIMLTLQIRDLGHGLSTAQLSQAGRAVFSTKPQGYGLGLLLSHATLERLGGEIRLEPDNIGGTLTLITVPLSALRMQQPLHA